MIQNNLLICICKPFMIQNCHTSRKLPPLQTHAIAWPFSGYSQFPPTPVSSYIKCQDTPNQLGNY